MSKINSIVKGQEIADALIYEYKCFIQGSSSRPRIGIVSVSENPVTASYINKKRLTAQSIGLPFIECFLRESISQIELETQVTKLAQEVDGLVVQLPLPKHIDTGRILSLIPPSHDIDCLNPQQPNRNVLAPVAGAVMEIIRYHQVDLQDKNIVVVGHGSLVGKPVAEALVAAGYAVSVLTDLSMPEERKASLGKADVIISGVGKAHSIVPNDIKEGVVLIDAGTSTSQGSLQGDSSLACGAKASLYSPTPGGVGPITIAKLFENLLTLQGIMDRAS